MRVRLRHDHLQLLLAKSRLSQNRWALKLGFSRGHWSDLVNGRHPYPSPKTRERLLEILGVPFEELFVIEPGATSWSDVDVRAALADRYLIDRELGQGGMGAVFLARDITRGRTVALKVISPEAVSGIGITAFMREISFLARLNHPHILPLFDSGVVAEHPFYVMPWMPDGSLRDRLRRRVRLSLAEALSIVRGVAHALHYAHAQRVLHCDVKPENVVLHGDHPYVMDFGIARAVHAEAASWHARSELDLSAGTPAYVSPEQAKGEVDLDARADVFSLACVTYEMLAGRPPFEGKDTLAVVSRRFREPPPPLRDFAPDVPDPAADWIQQAMAIDRAHRPHSAAEFAEGLSAATHSMSVMSRIVVGASRALGRIRRGRGHPPAPPLIASLRSLRQDAAHALRALRRSPRFALSVIIPLALALGAGAAILDLLNRMLFEPPAGVREPERVVRFGISTSQRLPPYRSYIRTGLTGLDYEALRDELRLTTHVAGYFVYSPSLGRGPNARSVRVALASASYFPLLGVTPARGRFYQDDEDVPGAATLPCVASDGFWRRELGGSPTLGQTLLVGQTRCAIVGVTPARFTGIDLSPIELWVPLRGGAVDFQGNDPRIWTTDRNAWLLLLGRLAPGVTPEAAAAEATLAYRSRAPRGRDPELRDQMVLRPLLTARGSRPSQGVRTAIWLAGGTAVLLLLITANLVNCFVARHLGRLRETAIRLALGGSRLRLFRYHAIEVGVLALLAGLAATLVARWVGPTARAILVPYVAWEGVGVLGRTVAAITTLIALVVGLLIAGLVALHTSRVDPVELLRSGGSPQVAGSRRARLRLALVGVQAALSMALVVLSAAFVRSFRTAADTDLGFVIDKVVVADLPLSSAGYDQARRWAFFERAREELRAVPGVVEASLGYMTPWNNNRNEELAIPGRDSLPPVPNFGTPAFDAVTPDYLRTMQLRLLEGRFISGEDRAGSAPVLVITQALARHYWPGESSVLGRCIRVGADSMPCRQIVGVVADYRFTGSLDDEPVPMYFLALDQARGFTFTPRLFVRVHGDPSAMSPTLRRTLQGLAGDLPAARVQPLMDLLDPLLAPWRLGAIAFSALGGLAATIAVLGLASVLSFVVTERRRDFAVRSALGASGEQIARPVVRQAVTVVAAGLVVGGLIARAASPLVQPLLFKVDLMDPLTLVALTLALLGATVLAALGPAQRAARSDPMEVLRAQ